MIFVAANVMGSLVFAASCRLCSALVKQPAHEKLTNFGSLGRPSALMSFAAKRCSM